MGSAEIIGLVVLGGILALFLRHAVHNEPDRFVARIVVVGLLAKLAGIATYYFVIAEVYGSGDATAYVNRGRALASMIRSGSLPADMWEPGTRAMELIVGVYFAVLGPNEVVAYLVFGLLSFVGMYLCLQAFRLAVPDGESRRYAVILLLLPTLVFWPSAVGKEAWLVFTLGIGSYGAARVLMRRRLGYLTGTIGVFGMAIIRPHMAALFAISFAIAFLFRLRDPVGKRRALVAWSLGLVLVTAGTGYALLNFSDEMGRSELDYMTPAERVAADTEEIFERTEIMTRRGEGQFDSRPVQLPGDFLHAMVTVPFRPFPWEGHNAQARLSGVEGLLLLALVLVSLTRLVSVPRQMFRSPYVALSFSYTIGFIVAFSHVGNFGILTRQRAQLMPLLLVLIALPLATERTTRHRQASRPQVLLPVPAGPDHTGRLPSGSPANQDRSNSPLRHMDSHTPSESDEAT